jgi:hypothetical protein
MFQRRVIARLVSTHSNLQPAYLLHPNVRTANPEYQLLALTKAQLIPRPPHGFLEYSRALDTTPWKAAVNTTIVHCRDFDSATKATPPHYPFSFVQNFIKILLSKSSLHPKLTDLFFGGNIHVTSTWEVLGRLVGVRGEVTGTTITSKSRWTPFFDQDVVQNSTEHKFASEEISDVFANLNSWNVHYNGTCESSFSFLYPHTHTVILIDNQATPEPQLIQRCALSLHGLLLNNIKKKYGYEGDVPLLPQPECAQGIITNGKRFSFMWYQLNTTDFSRLNEGRKNLISIYKPGLLYSKIARRRGGVSYTLRDLPDFNNDVLKTLLSMFLWQHH